MPPVYIESVLEKLLTPDSSVIKQGTKQLQDYFVSEKCVNGLFDVLKSSQNPQLRVYASTLLRKKVKNWKSLADHEKKTLKAEIINILLNEREEAVRKQIMWLIASIFKYCVKSKNDWNELLTFINSLITTSEEEKHLSGMFMLSILIEESAEQMKPHYPNLLQIFYKILNESVNLKSAFYVIRCICHIIPFTEQHEMTSLSNLFPLAIGASVKILKADQTDETTAEVLEFYQSLIEYDIPMLENYVKSLTEIVLEFMCDISSQNTTRVTFMNFLNVLIETQKGVILKHDMIKPIVNAAFMIMCQSNDPLHAKCNINLELLEDEKSEEEDVDDSENMFSAASQVLDYCALYFPSKKLVKIIIEYVSPTLSSEHALLRRAGLTALAITSEGCADYYKNHFLEILTDACLKGMQDTDSSVVQISYFALAQFSEFFQPNIGKFSDDVVKILIQSIETKPELSSLSRLTLRFFDALQSFCENSGDDLEQYLATIMSKLMTLEVRFSSSLKFKRLILSTFSSIVCAVKSKFDPYFDFVLQLIKPHIHLESDSLDTDAKQIQIECIVLMAVLAKNISKDKFNNILIENCLMFVQTILTNQNDSELRTAAFDLLSGLSTKLKENLPVKQIVPQLLETLRSEEGINLVEPENRKNDVFSVLDEIDLLDDDSDEDENLDEDFDSNEENLNDREDRERSFYETNANANDLVIENEYITEKLAAIFCLQEITKYQNCEFYEFYDECFDELKKLLNFVNINVRKESFVALANLISYYHDMCIKQKLENNEIVPEETKKKFMNNMDVFYKKTVKAIKLDLNRQLVMGVFNAVKLLLTRVSLFVKGNLNELIKYLESYGNIIVETFQNKIYCQMINKTSESNEAVDENEAEYDFILKEYAGDILPSLALCLDIKLFDSFFSNMLVYLIKLLNKPESNATEKSFVIGVIGETIANLDIIREDISQQLFAEFYKHLSCHEDELRSNTVFAIGILCSHSQNALYNQYPQIINDLYHLIDREKNRRTLDNICGTLSRLFSCTYSMKIPTIDYEMLLKKIFDLTPLRSDFYEYFTLYTMIMEIIADKLLLNYYPKIVDLSGKILTNNDSDLKPGTRELVLKFLKFVDSNFKEEFNILLDQLEKNVSDAIKQNI